MTVRVYAPSNGHLHGLVSVPKTKVVAKYVTGAHLPQQATDAIGDGSETFSGLMNKSRKKTENLDIQE